MAEVQLPDGTIIPVPDEVLGLKPPAAKPPSVGEDIFKRALPTAAGQGLMMGADVGVTALKALGHVVTNPRGIEPEEGTLASGISRMLARVRAPSERLKEQGPEEAKTGPGKYVQEIGTGAVGAMEFPGVLVPKLVSGAAGGAGGELAANMLEDKPWARIAGALAGGVGAYPMMRAGQYVSSALGGPGTRPAEIVSAAAKGTSPAEFERAAGTQAASREAGIPVTPVQALERPSALHGLQEKAISVSPELAAKLAAQNPQAQKGGMFFLDKLAAPAEPSAVATRAQGAAEGAIEKAKGFATEAAAPGYVIEVLRAPNQYVRAAAANMVATTNESPAAREFLRKEVFSKIGLQSGGASTIELKNVLNEAKRSLEDLGKPGIASAGVDNHAAGKIREALKDLELLVTAASANRPQSNTIMKQIYEDIVNPMKRSLTGKIAGVEGVVETGVPPTTRILGELNAPTVRAESIQRLAKDMARGGDAQAFPALVRGTWEQQLEKAFSGPAGTGSAPDAPAKFAQALRGTAEQTAKRENFRATIAEVARANGLSAREIDETVVGAEKFMRVMEAAGRAKGRPGAGISASGGPVENVLLRGGPGVQPTAQLRWFGQISEWANARSYDKIAEALTSPEGMAQFRQWANFKIGDYRWSAVSGAVAGETTQAKER